PLRGRCVTLPLLTRIKLNPRNACPSAGLGVLAERAVPDKVMPHATLPPLRLSTEVVEGILGRDAVVNLLEDEPVGPSLPQHLVDEDSIVLVRFRQLLFCKVLASEPQRWRLGSREPPLFPLAPALRLGPFLLLGLPRLVFPLLRLAV